MYLPISLGGDDQEERQRMLIEFEQVSSTCSQDLFERLMN